MSQDKEQLQENPLVIAAARALGRGVGMLGKTAWNVAQAVTNSPVAASAANVATKAVGGVADAAKKAISFAKVASFDSEKEKANVAATAKADPEKTRTEKTKNAVLKTVFEAEDIPPEILERKNKIHSMTNEERQKFFKGMSEETLVKMAESHGYGKDSNKYAQYHDGKS